MSFHVLFLCTGNSARSIIAESIADPLGQGRVHAFSAGSGPTGRVHPKAFDALRNIGMPTEGLRSKSWNEFAGPGAPEMDLIITLCDRAANEPCPLWPGHPLTARWSVPDPSRATGTDEETADAFRRALFVLQQRISLFLSLRIDSIDRLVAETQLRTISVSPNATC